MSKVFWAAGFITADVIIGVALIGLLCARECRVPQSLEWMFPLKGKWLWRCLLGLAVLAYAALAPVSLFILIRLVKAG